MTSSKDDRIAALQAHLREKLRGRLAGKTAVRSDTIPPADRNRPSPLSPIQRHLWFLDRVQAGPEHNTATAVRLRGALDVARLVDALLGLVHRHEILRTTFVAVDGAPIQVIAPEGHVDFSLVDCTTDLLHEVLRTEAARPFDLATGPLLRATLVQASAEDHVLLLCSHRIAVDDWSFGLLLEELGVLYEGLQLPPPVLQYVDFAAWQRERTYDVGHWRNRLTGVERMELFTDRPRPAERTAAGGTHTFIVPEPLVQRLAELAQSCETTLFTVLLTACQVLLARLTGQTDVIIGTVTSGRDRPELAGVVGPLANTVVMRSAIDSDLGVAEQLERITNTALDAFAHEVPFDHLVQALGIDRDPGRTPLFDVMVVLDHARPLAELPGLEVTGHRLTRGIAHHDLAFEWSSTSDGLAGAVHYRTDLFDAATTRRLTSELLELLGGMVEDPDRPLSALASPAAQRRGHDMVESPVAGDRDARDLDRRLSDGLSSLHTGLGHILDIEAGLSDARLPGRHAALTKALDDVLDLASGLAAIVSDDHAVPRDQPGACPNAVDE